MKPEIKYGFLAGFALIAWTLVQYFLKFHTIRFGYNSYTWMGMFLILFVALVMGLREKKADLSGLISVRQGVRSGIFQLTITAVIASGFMFVYDYNINPLWVENLVEWERYNGNSGFFLRLANDPSATAVILSNTETHLCFYFLSILMGGGMLSFLISVYYSNKSDHAVVPGLNHLRKPQKGFSEGV